ncbi:MAG: DedA family protein [Ignavibacteria bacterium]|nr:DedA family protein [Ignavibacteria bacterium]MBI3766306.1 DedA family protein [Ignavibacteriales bacterium]
MELIEHLIDFILHVDIHLNELITLYGNWTYAILFIIIFCETGLVVTPFLPGDSLLFAAGAFAAAGSLDASWLWVLLSVAAIAGNIVNYHIGHFLGPTFLQKRNVRFLNKEYLERTHTFYEKHGGKTIVIARFIPIIRTFAPFVAGIGFMRYGKFMLYNVGAGIGWVGIFVLGGYYFGNLPGVKNHFTLVIFAIIIISTLPAVIEFVRHKFRSS